MSRAEPCDTPPVFLLNTASRLLLNPSGLLPRHQHHDFVLNVAILCVTLSKAFEKDENKCCSYIELVKYLSEDPVNW